MPSRLTQAIVGLPHEKWGEAPQAFVVLKSGASATEDDLRACLAYAADGIAHEEVYGISDN